MRSSLHVYILNNSVPVITVSGLSVYALSQECEVTMDESVRSKPQGPEP